MAVEVELEGVLAIRPRRSDGDPVRLCAEHAKSVADEVRRKVESAIERTNPNMNRSNRAMSGENLGDAED